VLLTLAYIPLPFFSSTVDSTGFLLFEGAGLWSGSVSTGSCLTADSGFTSLVAILAGFLDPIVLAYSITLFEVSTGFSTAFVGIAEIA